jgi:DNA-binding winged helix-turn-helix (wHTH) protein/Flp pilus assembly protein TadD
MPAVRFGRFEFDPGALELRREGRRVRLQARPARVLALLVARGGAVVSRDEIRSHVWGETTWVDFDHNLRLCIYQVRAALGDVARAPRFVETVPGRGYRFLAPVEALEAPAAAPVPPAASRRPRRLGLAAAAVLTAGLVFGSEPKAAVPAASDGPPAYLRGAYLKRSGPASLEAAAAAFEEASLEAPGRADIDAAAAETWVEIADLGLRPSREALGRAESAARRALRSDPGNARAHVALGVARLAGEWDWDGARASLQRALAADPGLVAAHTSWAAYLSATGDQQGALRAVARARALDPVCPLVRGDAGWYYYCARRFDDAASEWQRAAAIEPGQAGVHERLVRALRHAGRLSQAEAEARETLRLAGFTASGPVDLRDFLAGTARWLEKTEAPGPDALERRAALYASLGLRERALETIEAAARARSRFLLRHLAADPDLDALRQEPRFEAIARSVGYHSS